MIGPINSTTGELYIAVYPTKSTGYGLIVPYDAIKSEIEKSQANTTTTNNNNTTLIAFLVIFIILFVGLLSGVIIYWFINRNKKDDNSQLEQEINV